MHRITCKQIKSERQRYVDSELLCRYCNINPDTIIDTATFSEPHQFPKGIEHVFVNGKHAIESGQAKNVFAGKVL